MIYRVCDPGSWSGDKFAVDGCLNFQPKFTGIQKGGSDNTPLAGLLPVTTTSSIGIIGEECVPGRGASSCVKLSFLEC